MRADIYQGFAVDPLYGRQHLFHKRNPGAHNIFDISFAADGTQNHRRFITEGQLRAQIGLLNGLTGRIQCKQLGPVHRFGGHGRYLVFNVIKLVIFHHSGFYHGNRVIGIILIGIVAVMKTGFGDTGNH